MLHILNIRSASESEKLNNERIKSLKKGITIPFDEVNELLDTEWKLDIFKLVASFYNTRKAEGDFVFTGNLDSETELNYFEMVKRVLTAFVIDHPESRSFPPAVLMRILSSSENKCFLGCVMSFMPEDFCNTLNANEVFLSEVHQSILSTAEKRYDAL